MLVTLLLAALLSAFSPSHPQDSVGGGPMVHSNDIVGGGPMAIPASPNNIVGGGPM